MKKILLITALLSLHCLITAQKTRNLSHTSTVQSITAEDIKRSPFSKGIWEYNILIPNLQYAHQNVKSNNVDQGKQGRLGLDIGANYYVADHVGIGLELLSNISVFKSVYNSKTNSSNWMTYANITYGTTTSNFNIYGRLGVGIGGDKTKYTISNGNSTTDKEDLFGYKLNVGFPMQLNHGVTYFTPEIGYNYLQRKFDVGKETDTRFGINLKFETFLFCREMECDSRMHHAFSSGAYNQGRSFLGVTTRGMLDFGSVKTTYNNTTASNKETYSTGSLDLYYKYYIVDNLSLGASVGFGNGVYKSSSGSNQQSSNNFLFMPMAELNIPSDNPGLRNLFVTAGYGVGAQKVEYVNGNNTTTTNFNVTDLNAGIGYNFFIHKGLSFTPVVAYDMSTSKNKTTDVKTDYSGIQLEIGFRKFF